MRATHTRRLVRPWTALLCVLLGGCFDDIHLGTHACLACRPCETCISVIDGVATCEPTPAEGAQCGIDGHVHEINSCGEPGALLVACDNAYCQNTAPTEAECSCRNRWQGEDCATCADHWDPAQDCGQCKNHWTGDECDECPANWDPGRDCAECAGHWEGAQCEVCPGNWDPANGCDRCKKPYTDENNDCGTCKSTCPTLGELACEGGRKRRCVGTPDCRAWEPWQACGTNLCSECAGLAGIQQDCLGAWGGLAYEDACGHCDGTPENDCPDCAVDNGGCDPLVTCANTAAGTRICGACPGGYTGDGEVGCTDVDECATNNGGCDALATCTNQPGARDCGTCPGGYSGTGEAGCYPDCAVDNGGCDALTTCTNPPGMRTCGACPGGYSGDGETGCTDMDECATNNGDCDPIVTCANEPGTRTCGACPAGYAGDGEAGCYPDCAIDNGGCDALTTCTNTSDTRTCGACPNGYAGDGEAGCTDIDECATNNGGCDPLTACLNELGSRSCGACPAGYTGEGATGCTDINECAVGNGGCEQRCLNYPGSHGCGCDVGFLLEADAVSCVSRQWSTALELYQGCCLGDGRDPDIAMDPDGNTHAVWRQWIGGWDDLRAMRYTPGVGWGAVEFPADGAASALYPQIALDASGNAIAVWQEAIAMNPGVYRTWANRFVPGTGWGSPAAIEDAMGDIALFPQLAVGGTGDAVAVWQLSNGATYVARANRFTPATGWGVAESIGAVGGGLDERDPRVVTDDEGNAIALWEENDPFAPNVWSNLAMSGGPWESAKIIGAGATAPEIEGRPSGLAIAMWSQAGRLEAGLYTPGNGWSGLPTVASLVALRESAQIGIDDIGNAVAVWAQREGTRYDIWANRYLVQSAWLGPEKIETDDAGHARRVDLVVNAVGNAVAVWQQSDGTRENIWANLFVPGGGWGSATMIEGDDVGDAEFPRVAMDDMGRAMAIWGQDLANGQRTIRVNRLE